MSGREPQGGPRAGSCVAFHPQGGRKLYFVPALLFLPHRHNRMSYEVMISSHFCRPSGESASSCPDGQETFPPLRVTRVVLLALKLALQILWCYFTRTMTWKQFLKLFSLSNRDRWDPLWRGMLEGVRTGLFKHVRIRNDIRDPPSHVWGQGRGPSNLTHGLFIRNKRGTRWVSSLREKMCTFMVTPLWIFI